MGITVTRLPEFGLNVTVYSGKITHPMLLAHVGSMTDPLESGRWLNYFDPSADMSELELSSYIEMKRLVASKLAELYPEKPFRSAVVSNTEANRPVLGFWKSYVSNDRAHPAAPMMFSSLQAACDWLDLSDEARRAIGDLLGEDCGACGAPSANATSRTA